MIYRFLLLASAAVFIYVTTNKVLNDQLNLSPNGMKRFNNLTTFTDRLQFTLVHLSIPVFFLNVQVLLTIFKRLSTAAIDPSPNNDKHVFRANSILRNYFEQFVISVIAQLSLLPHLTAKQTLQYIPLINLFFVIGRITFYLGYPRHRSFGFLCCLAPSLVASVLSAYKFYSIDLLDFYKTIGLVK